MFARWLQPRRACQSARRRHSVLLRPLVEVLEDRTLLSTFMVDRLTDTGAGSDLAGDLRYCVTQAADGDNIQFGAQGAINLTHPLPDLTKKVGIDGPGADLLTVRRDTGGIYRIFTVGSGATVSIFGLTIANGQTSNAEGGGIRNDGTLTVSNSILSGNFVATDHSGGGIYNSASGVLTVSSSTLSGNRGADEGGAIRNDGTLTVSNSTLSGNGARDGGAISNHGTLTVNNSTLSRNSAGDGSGGAIGSDAGTVTVTNSTLSGNGAGHIGGAIGIWGGSLNVSDSTVSGNMTFESSYRAATIYIGGAPATITNSTISGNRSSGGTIGCFGTVTISNSTISGNTAGDVEAGGGIYNQGTLTVSNSTISGNTVSNPNSAGGIFNRGTLTVSNSTISGNTATVFAGGGGSAGGIANFAGARDATVMLLNSTIGNNTVSSNNHTGSQLVSGHIGTGTGKATVQSRNTIIAGDGSRPNLFLGTGGTFVSQGHNLSSDDGSGFLTGPGDLINTDPLLGPLQDNGGPTQTMALLPGSPAIDAGDNSDAPSTDQRGLSRIVAGTIDIGAFEVQIGAATRLVVSAPSSVTAGSPFDITVTALDNYGHVAAGYTGTVTFSTTDSDARVVLPADYTFTAADGGVHTFTGTGLGETTLVTPGDQTVTATDTANGTITGSATVTVAPGPAAPPGGAASKPLTPTVTDNAAGWSVQPARNVSPVDIFPPVYHPIIISMPFSPNQGFVTQVYFDLLQRPVDPSGFDTWTAFLDQGHSRTQLVQAIQSSLEYRALVVQQLYGQILGRPVDPSGFMTWVSFLAQGHTAQELQSVLFGSDEYLRIALDKQCDGGALPCSIYVGMENDIFLSALYRDVLQREIDASGSLSWGRALSNGVSRTAVAAAILNSVESDRLEVTGLYAQFLHRQPDNGGLNAFTNALQQGVSNEQVLAAIVGSEEYFASVPPLPVLWPPMRAEPLV